MHRRLIPALVLASLLAGCDACDVDPLSDIPEPGSISGRVCDPGENRGIFGARVWVVIEYGDGNTGEIEATTDAEGNFVIDDVPIGSYTVYVQRGSFRQQVEAVEVEEATLTEIDSSACIAPEVVMTVYDGHDNVEVVLSRLGYGNFDVVDTLHEWDEHDENTASWLVDHFAIYEDFSHNDILFINCAAHEWAIDNATSGDMEQVWANLRRFIADGGSIYMSDWAYDIFEELYPEAVDWLGDDLIYNEAEQGLEQAFVGDVLDEDMATVLGRDRASLKYDFSRIAMPDTLGEGTRAMITADIEIEGLDGQPYDATAVPVLIEHRPPLNEGEGRIIYTTFHNGANNTEAMDEVLRAIVYSL
jgi:hypothetical protein